MKGGVYRMLTEYLYDGNGTKMPKDGFGRRIVKHR